MDIKFAVMQVLEAYDGIALDNAAERDRLASAIASALRARLDGIVQGHRDALKAAREERDEAIHDRDAARAEAYDRVNSLEDQLRGCHAIIGEDFEITHRVITERDAARAELAELRGKAESELKLCLIERDASEARVLELQDQREAARDALRVRTRELAELRAQLDEAGAVAEPPFPMIGVGR